MRITVLGSVEQSTDAPDVVVGQVADALRRAGHEVATLCQHGDLHALIAGLREQRPELVFNLTEQFGEDVHGDIAVAALLDLLGLRYTGCGPGELYLAQDKVLGKKLLAFDEIGYPPFALFSRDAELESVGHLHLPLFVKPARGDASIGIDKDALVRDVRALLQRVTMIHEQVGDDALVEEFVQGREFYVGVLGNHEPLALPVVEMDFGGLQSGQPHILDHAAKMDQASAEYQGTKARLAELPDELRARLQDIALGAYRALRVRDYGRVDLRMTEAGDVFVLEVNAGPYLEEHDELALAASAAGIPYDALVARIVDEALGRYARAAVKASSDPDTPSSPPGPSPGS